MQIEVYRHSQDGTALCQGEIVQNVVQFELAQDAVVKGASTGSDRIHPLAIILTADCDLTQDFTSRQEIATLRAKFAQVEAGDKKVQKQFESAIASAENTLLSNILFAKVFEFDKARPKLLGILQDVIQNDHQRYHFLCEAEKAEDQLGIGLPTMLIDFRRYFTLPTAEVYAKLSEDCVGDYRIRRRSCLAPPYVQHLTSRFAVNISRVALEKTHEELTGMSDSEVVKRLEESDTMSLEEVQKELGRGS